MALIRWPMFAAFVVLPSWAGCATAPEPPARSPGFRGVDGPAASSPDLSPERDVTAAATSKRAPQQADDASADELALESQVALLRQSIVLYRQFIERAEHDSQYAEAVRRSRERIEDAQATIDFLLAGSTRAP